MPRPLKVFKTHIGFYDMIVSAPSMKAAAAAWDVSPRVFLHGIAAPTSDPVEIGAAMEHPGTVLKRLHGRKDAFVSDPHPPRAPGPSRKGKKQTAEARHRQQLRQAKAERERREAEKQARDEAAKEFADLARQEAALKKKRQALKKQFHLHDT